MRSEFTLEGKLTDVVSRRTFNGGIRVSNGIISQVYEKTEVPDRLILPGLIDAHVHIESSMLVPSEFARIAVVHGTIGAVTDPHEIANVLGTAGIQFMMDNSREIPFHYCFGAPSCVPATPFESSGANLGTDQVEMLLKNPAIGYLSEMMNYPGVIFRDPEVMMKLELARRYGKPIDGHAPGLTGKDLESYVSAGVSTDHECFTREEALEKIKLGMHILIREGSAARNFDTLIPLLRDYPEHIMFCSDDKHPDDLLKGHINQLVRKAIRMGYDPMDILRACTYNPVKHYGLKSGLLQPGDSADFIVADNFRGFHVLQTFIRGIEVARDGKSLIKPVEVKERNNFKAKPISPKEIQIPAKSEKIQVIRAMDGQLITGKSIEKGRIQGRFIISDPDHDILKIVVVNRYSFSPPAVGFISGFRLKSGAMASTIAHDSHNIISVGTNDQDIVNAVNHLIELKGGICVVDGRTKMSLPLPVAGIMSPRDAKYVARRYKKIDRETKKLGSMLVSPFMTLSFMALLVIPELKMSDRGLFDGQSFKFTSVYDI